jgi:hypothetical protein
VSVEFPHGLDYSWVALDGAGHVAIFTNAGSGPIPATVIADRPAADDAEGLVLDLTERGGGLQLVDTPVRDAFRVFANRGLFAYDWSDVHRVAVEATHSYELVARPNALITAADLSPELARLAGSTRLDALRFADVVALDIRRHAIVVDSEDS